jgi:DNA modification methylase
MKLSPNEIRDITNLLEAGKPLPEKYRFVLFGEQRNVELIWDGKSNSITEARLPFQIIEQVDEPRSEKTIQNQLGLFDVSTGRQLKGWSNKLIWGDNKFVLSSLKSGQLRDEIDKNGGIKFVYIDPPFDVGADFSVNIEIGDESFDKKPSVLEEIAYRDTWGKGNDSFLSMLYERLRLIKEILADDGVIFVHTDYRVSSRVRLILDEIFGVENFRNEIVWCYRGMSVSTSHFVRRHDNIYFYSKSENYTFDWENIAEELADSTVKKYTNVDEEGRRFRLHGRNIQGSPIKNHTDIDAKWLKTNPELCSVDYLDSKKGSKPRDWIVMDYINVMSDERVHYPTQKPKELLEKFIKVATKEGDIVADFFGGSGTLADVAEENNRKWICSDLGKFAIHTTRKRLITTQRKLKDLGKNWRAFELLNLGKYERGMLLANHTGLESDQYLEEIQNLKDRQFEQIILTGYNATKIENDSTFVGTKNNRLITIGPINLPVTRLFVEKVIEESKRLRATKVDVLAFEYEMGLFPNIQDEARKLGVDISFKYIPRDIFDKRAVQSGQVKFHDVAYIEVKPVISGNFVEIHLADYSVGYQQDSIATAEKELTKTGSKIVIDNGQVIKLKRSKDGIFEREVLTKSWKDWIDYWAIDWDFANRKEIVNIKNSVTGELEQQWTGDFIFENEWQSFRTQKQRNIEFVSVKKEIPNGARKIAVKVVDIFGNDTMKIIEVKIGK